MGYDGNPKTHESLASQGPMAINAERNASAVNAAASAERDRNPSSARPTAVLGNATVAHAQALTALL